MLATYLQQKCSACLWRRLMRISVNGIAVIICPVCDLRPWRWEDGE